MPFAPSAVRIWRNRNREIRRKIAAERLHTELCSGTFRNVEPHRPRVRLEAVSARRLDGASVCEVAADAFGTHVFRLNSHEADAAAHCARLDIAGYVFDAQIATDRLRSQIPIH